MAVIALNPTTALRGATVVITGTGLKSRATLRLAIDGKVSGSTFRATRAGTFTLKYVVIYALTNGPHTLKIQSQAHNGWVDEGSPMTLTILATLPVPTPIPTPPPTPPVILPTIINVPAGGKGVVITQNNQIIENLTIVGPGSTTNDGTFGIYASGAYSGVVIRNCTIKNISGSGIWLINLVNPVIEDCIIEDVAYSGIMTLGVKGGRISRNTVSRIGLNGPFGGNNNAYGIAISGLLSTTCSSDIMINDNTITDVPFWHGLDTHGGLRITFNHNTVRRTPRPIFITTGDFSGGTAYSTDCTISNNLFTDPLVVSGGTNLVGITAYTTVNCSFTGNRIGAAFGSPTVYDYNGLSTGLIQTGNITGEVLP